MEKFICKNRQIIEERQAQISIKERGFLFGDGIFESIKIFNGKIYDFSNHFERIESGLKLLKFNAEITDLEKDSQQLIVKNKLKNGILRISISRGIGSAGYLPTADCKALVIIETLEEREFLRPILLGVSEITTPKIAIKSMNSIPYILNKIAAREAGVFDLVMLSDDGFIAETSSANIFWVKNGKIYTSDENCNIVAGCVRKKILNSFNLNITKTRARILALEEADEIFLTNSSFLILAVDEFLGRKLQKKISLEIFELMELDLRRSCK